jgi:hypothetical protein
MSFCRFSIYSGSSVLWARFVGVWRRCGARTVAAVSEFSFVVSSYAIGFGFFGAVAVMFAALGR